MKNGPLARSACPQIAQHWRPTEVTSNWRLSSPHILEQPLEEALEARIGLARREAVAERAVHHVREPLRQLDLLKSAAANAQWLALVARLVRLEEGNLRIARLPVELVLVEGLSTLSSGEHEALTHIVVNLHRNPARRASRYPGRLVADGKATVPTARAVGGAARARQRHPLGQDIAANHALLILLLVHRGRRRGLRRGHRRGLHR